MPHGPFTGAVVSLLPAPDEATRLVVPGAEPVESLHVTLAWLGDTDGDPSPQQSYEEAVEAVQAAIARATPGDVLSADGFAVAVFNPEGFDPDRDPATVLLLQSQSLADLRGLMQETVADLSDFPVWFPHLTLGYSIAPLTDEQVAERVGPITFDRVAVSYGSERTTEISLGGEPMTASTKPRRRVQVNVPEQFRGRGQTLASEDDACPEGMVQDADGNCVEIPPDETGETTPTEEQEAAALPSRWEGVLAVEGSPTGDGRLMERGSLRWSDLPIPLRDAPTDEGEHRGAVVVGQIVEVWREGGEIRASGTFDLDSPEGREAARKVGAGLKQGVSVDLDDVDLEIRVAAEVLDKMEQEVAAIFDEDGDTEQPEREVDGEGRVVVAEFDADDEMLVTTDGRIRAATIVDIPAFVEARIAGVVGDAEEVEAPREPLVAAAAVPDAPPSDWFANPGFGSSPTEDPRLVEGPNGEIGCPLTVTEDGRVFGHLALWASCHTAFPNECVSPPTSETDYAYFRVGAVRTREGSEVPTGRLTVDTLHAGRRASAADTLAHYEHTGLAVADVSAGEDAHGVWIAGSLRPEATDEQVRALRSSPLSGDWRRVGGNLELVAALAVNSPGFPVPRAMVAGGAVTALQRASVLLPEHREEVSDDERILARMIERERKAERARRSQADKARRRVLVASAAARIRGGR